MDLDLGANSDSSIQIQIEMEHIASLHPDLKNLATDVQCQEVQSDHQEETSTSISVVTKRPSTIPSTNIVFQTISYIVRMLL